MGRRFFQRFQKSVKCTGGEHVYLVDDVHFIFRFGRHEHDFVTDPADIIYAVITGGIHFNDIKKRAVDDAFTDLTFIAGIAVDRMQTVDRTGEDFRNRGLTGASCTAEKIGVTDLSGENRLT